MGDWLDDFMVMEILKDRSDAGNDDSFDTDQEDDPETKQALESLQNELSLLQDELITVDCNEPED